MAANPMRQMVDRGAAFAQMLAKHAKAAAAGTRLTQLDDAAAAIAKPQTQQQLQPDQQSQLGSRAPTMVFLGAPGAGKLPSLVPMLDSCPRHKLQDAHSSRTLHPPAVL